MSIRPPSAADAAEVIALNRASARYHAPWVSPPVDEASYTRYLSRCSEESFRGFLICRVADGAAVGAANLSQIFRGDFLNAYLGFYVGAPFAGRGFMRRGLSLVLEHALGPLDLHRVEANVQPRNAGSVALVRRLGFRLEGFSPRYLRVAGEWRDHERYAMLAEEWPAARSTTLDPPLSGDDP